MRIIGIIAVSAAGVVAAISALVGIRSIPDLKRYLKIRSM